MITENVESLLGSDATPAARFAWIERVVTLRARQLDTLHRWHSHFPASVAEEREARAQQQRRVAHRRAPSTGARPPLPMPGVGGLGSPPPSSRPPLASGAGGVSLPGSPNPTMAPPFHSRRPSGHGCPFPPSSSAHASPPSATASPPTLFGPGHSSSSGFGGAVNTAAFGMARLYKDTLAEYYAESPERETIVYTWYELGVNVGALMADPIFNAASSADFICALHETVLELEVERAESSVASRLLTARALRKDREERGVPSHNRPALTAAAMGTSLLAGGTVYHPITRAVSPSSAAAAAAAGTGAIRHTRSSSGIPAAQPPRPVSAPTGAVATGLTAGAHAQVPPPPPPVSPRRFFGLFGSKKDAATDSQRKAPLPSETDTLDGTVVAHHVNGTAIGGGGRSPIRTADQRQRTPLSSAASSAVAAATVEADSLAAPVATNAASTPERQTATPPLTAATTSGGGGFFSSIFSRRDNTGASGAPPQPASRQVSPSRLAAAGTAATGVVPTLTFGASAPINGPGAGATGSVPSLSLGTVAAVPKSAEVSAAVAPAGGTENVEEDSELPPPPPVVLSPRDRGESGGFFAALRANADSARHRRSISAQSGVIAGASASAELAAGSYVNAGNATPERPLPPTTSFVATTAGSTRAPVFPLYFTPSSYHYHVAASPTLRLGVAGPSANVVIPSVLRVLSLCYRRLFDQDLSRNKLAFAKFVKFDAHVEKSVVGVLWSDWTALAQEGIEADENAVSASVRRWTQAASAWTMLKNLNRSNGSPVGIGGGATSAGATPSDTGDAMCQGASADGGLRALLGTPSSSAGPNFFEFGGPAGGLAPLDPSATDPIHAHPTVHLRGLSATSGSFFRGNAMSFVHQPSGLASPSSHGYNTTRTDAPAPAAPPPMFTTIASLPIPIVNSPPSTGAASHNIPLPGSDDGAALLSAGSPSVVAPAASSELRWLNLPSAVASAAADLTSAAASPLRAATQLPSMAAAAWADGASAVASRLSTVMGGGSRRDLAGPSIDAADDTTGSMEREPSVVIRPLSVAPHHGASQQAAIPPRGAAIATMVSSSPPNNAQALTLAQLSHTLSPSAAATATATAPGVVASAPVAGVDAFDGDRLRSETPIVPVVAPSVTTPKPSVAAVGGLPSISPPALAHGASASTTAAATTTVVMQHTTTTTTTTATALSRPAADDIWAEIFGDDAPVTTVAATTINTITSTVTATAATSSSVPPPTAALTAAVEADDDAGAGVDNSSIAFRPSISGVSPVVIDATRGPSFFDPAATLLGLGVTAAPPSAAQANPLHIDDEASSVALIRSGAAPTSTIGVGSDSGVGASPASGHIVPRSVAAADGAILGLSQPAAVTARPGTPSDLFPAWGSAAITPSFTAYNGSVPPVIPADFFAPLPSAARPTENAGAVPYTPSGTAGPHGSAGFSFPVASVVHAQQPQSVVPCVGPAGPSASAIPPLAPRAAPAATATTATIAAAAGNVSGGSSFTFMTVGGGGANDRASNAEDDDDDGFSALGHAVSGSRAHSRAQSLAQSSRQQSAVAFAPAASPFDAVGGEVPGGGTADADDGFG